jgi:ATP-dependent exoDNAse (exonuclease V) beta subunit
MTDRQPLDDAAVRTRALAPDASFIVQAPAGSGKTELLTQRFLGLLATVDAPEAIVAITFTRKAAAEMRVRILAALDQARGPKPDTEPELARWRLAHAALARSTEQGWALDRNPGRLRVLTLDGLDRRLASRLPVLAGGRAGMGLAERPQTLYREAARRCFVEGGLDAEDSVLTERILEHLDNQLPMAIDLVASLLARRDQWSHHLAAGAGDERGSLEAGLGALARWAIERFAKALGDTGCETIAEAAAASAAALGAASRSAACAGLDGVPDRDATEAWRGMAALILTTNSTLRKSLTKKDGVASGTEIYEAAKALLAHLAGSEELIQAARMVRVLPATSYDEESWTVLRALPRVLRLAVAHLELLFRERGQIDYAGISQAARDALSDDGAPSELLLALDHQISHLLVDEFQDTSARQTLLIRLLTEGWSPGDGRTLFCVGDPMQSIYRFREADVGLFLATWAQGLGDLELEPLRLSANFRSSPGIVGWVNSTFSQLLPRTDDAVLGKVAYTASSATKPDDDLEPVSWIATPGSGAPGLAEQVSDTVVRLRTDHPDERIAILVQKRTQLATLLPALSARGLRFRGLDLLRLEQRPAVQDLMSLYRAMTHSGDRAAWLALLRSPLCGLDLHAMESMIGRDGAPVPDQLRDAAKLARVSEDDRIRVQRLMDALDSVQPLRRSTSARRWLEAAWIATGGAAMQADASASEDAEVLLDLIGSLDSGGEVGGIDEFEEAMSALFAPPDPEGDEALQVMTVHAAKGLEFDHVVLMLPHTAGRGDGSPLLHHAELRGASTDPGAPPDRDPVVLAPIGAYGDDADPVHACLSMLSRERDSYELGRLLYVATTRAKRQLILAGTSKVIGEGDARKLQKPSSGSLLRLLWGQAETPFEAALDGIATVASPAAARRSEPSFRRLRADWRLPEPPPAAFEVAAAPPHHSPDIEFSWASETARHVGTLVHRILQQVAEEGLAAWDADRLDREAASMRMRLLSLGVPDEGVDDALMRAKAALLAALSCEKGRWLLDEHEEAACELGISGVDDGAVIQARIDRCFIDEEGARWIVDYKTSAHEGGDQEAFLRNEADRYAPQLERYARLFSALEDRPIRTALYYPAMQKLVEVTR